MANRSTALTRSRQLVDEQQRPEQPAAVVPRAQARGRCVPALFKSRITERNLIMAAGEAVSHLNYLVERGEMQVTKDANGVNWYCMCT
jgi:hypothetical protein